MGYEEALGYAVGDAVRDKDGIAASLVLADLAARLEAEGRTLDDRLDRPGPPPRAAPHGEPGRCGSRAPTGSPAGRRRCGASAPTRPAEVAGRPVVRRRRPVGCRPKGARPGDVVVLELGDGVVDGGEAQRHRAQAQGLRRGRGAGGAGSGRRRPPPRRTGSWPGSTQALARRLGSPLRGSRPALASPERPARVLPGERRQRTTHNGLGPCSSPPSTSPSSSWWCSRGAGSSVPTRPSGVIFILAASCVFYSWWNWHYLGLLFTSIAVNWFFGRAVFRALTPGGGAHPGEPVAGAGRRSGFDLGLLGYFKYYDFFVTLDLRPAPQPRAVGEPPAARDRPPGRHLVLHVPGASATSSTSVGASGASPLNLLDFAVYLSFFAHLVAGPIVRASEFCPQLDETPTPGTCSRPRPSCSSSGGCSRRS